MDDFGFAILFIFVVVAVIGAVIAAVVGYNRTTNRNWIDAAARLGFHYTPPSFFSSTRNISGIYQGYAVVVDAFVKGAGKHAQHFSRFRVNLIPPLSLGLKISRQGFLSGVAKLFGAQDIETGDSPFDDKVVVKGMSPTLVKEFLTPPRRAAIGALLDSCKEATIDDEAIIWQKHGTVRDADMMVATVETMIGVARLLGSADGTESVDEASDAVPVGQRAHEAGDDSKSHGSNSMASEIDSIANRDREPDALTLMAVEEVSVDNGRSSTPSSGDDEGWSTVPSYESAAVRSASVDGVEVAQQLFESGVNSFRAQDLFRERFQGKTVSAAAILRSVSDFAYDSPFGGKEGCRAVFELALADGEFSNRGVQAIVLLPTDLAPRIRTQIGARLSFSGTLVHCDGLLRNLFVADAQLVE